MISIVCGWRRWYHVQVMRFVWKNLPVFLIWLIGLSVMNNALHHIVPPMEDILWLTVFPLAASLILLFFAMVKDHGVWKRYFLWAGIMTTLYFTPLMHHISIPIDSYMQRTLYEMSAFMQFALIVLHARTWLKEWDWAWVFGVTLIFGFILENGGIIIGFFSEPEYHLYLPGIPSPVATAIGWVNVLYCAFFAVERVLPTLHPIARGLVCALIGLCLDIPFDPVATRLCWWVWNPGLEASIWGVPVINFIAWFWAIFPYAACYYWVRTRPEMKEGTRMGWFMGMMPLILLVELMGVLGCLALIGDAKALDIFKGYFISQVVQ